MEPAPLVVHGRNKGLRDPGLCDLAAGTLRAATLIDKAPSDPDETAAYLRGLKPTDIDQCWTSIVLDFVLRNPHRLGHIDEVLKEVKFAYRRFFMGDNDPIGEPVDYLPPEIRASCDFKPNEPKSAKSRIGWSHRYRMMEAALDRACPNIGDMVRPKEVIGSKAERMKWPQFLRACNGKYEKVKEGPDRSSSVYFVRRR